MFGPLCDWQKGRWLPSPCRSRLPRDRSETVDTKDLLVGDRSNGCTPYDGIFISGHAVKCGESGTIGETDTMRKVWYDESIYSQAGCEGTNSHGLDTASMHTYRSPVSESKTLEGYGQHVATTPGQKTSSSHALTSPSSNILFFLSVNHFACFTALGSEPRPHSVTRESQLSRQTHQQDWWLRRLGFARCPHDSLLLETMHR